MKHPIAWGRAVFVTSTLCLASAPLARAQTATATPAAQTATAAPASEPEDTVVLSPFVVEATEDSGYAAKSTLAGTRVRTELKDVGSAISVVTPKFLSDTNSHNSQELLTYTTGTEVRGQGGNFLGAGDSSVLDTTAYTKPVANTRVRGLAEADNLRDFFLTDIPWDSYNTGRVDLQRGANSILFGIGSPAGIINSSINPASFRNSRKVEVVVNNYGSVRFTGDFNQVILPNELAARISFLRDNTKYKQKPAFRDDSRVYAALRYDLKLFATDSAHTSFRVNFEKGTVRGNEPRYSPPYDAITPWFTQMNKSTHAWFNANNMTDAGHPADYSPWYGAAGSRIWDGVVTAFASPTATTQAYKFTASPHDNPATSNTADASNTNGSYKGIVLYNIYASNAKLPGYKIQPFKAKSLTDASIFDFYNNLLEGDNKSNFDRFRAYNFNASQTFFNNKLGFELAYDNQWSKWGYKNFFSGDAAAITTDVMTTLIDGSAGVVLAYENYGSGTVAFGGMTEPYYWATSGNTTISPVTLLGNELSFVANATAQQSPSAVPEPSTYGLMGAGALAGLGLFRRLRRQQA